MAMRHDKSSFETKSAQHSTAGAKSEGTAVVRKAVNIDSVQTYRRLYQ
jgi:hypothetical protein